MTRWFKVLIIFLLFVLIVSVSGGVASKQSIVITSDLTIPTIIEVIAIPSPIVTPEPTYPKPTYTPTLRKYEINKDHDIWHAQDPSSYITPDNEWVQYYAKNNLSVGIMYRTDDDMYNYPVNGDMWQNADYTLYTGYGDCEDIAIAEASIKIAKGYKSIVVGGYIILDNGQRIRDFIVEYYDDGISIIVSPVGETQKQFRFEPVYMFNNEIQWSDYNANWYK